MNRRKIIMLSLLLSISFEMLSQTSLELKDLAGKWYVVQSNFPMWVKGKKTNPTFTYSPVTKKNKPVLLDEVKYLKKSKEKTLVGYDYPVNEQNRSFVWRGKGILGFLKSKWSVLYVDPKQQWAIIQFKKTLFTPAGVDVISRSKKLAPEIQKEVEQKLSGLGIKEKLPAIQQE